MRPKQNHRIVAGTKAGRSLTQSKAAHIANDNDIPKDILEHNKRIDMEKAIKKLARIQKQLK